MKRFKLLRYVPCLVSIHDPIVNLFHTPRHFISSSHRRELRAAAMDLWTKIAQAWASRIAAPDTICRTDVRFRRKLA